MQETVMSRNRRIVHLALLGGAALWLVGCDSIRDAAGITKSPPDEFAVVTKAPLVIPPDFNLHPPKPGAAPTNQSSPTDSAQAALFGSDDPAAIAAALPSTFSSGEKTLLANSGGANVDHGIRAQIAADAKAMATANDSFTDQLLFRAGPDPNAGNPVNADAEHERLVAARGTSQTPVEGQTPPEHDAQEGATIDKGHSDRKVTDNSGWFSGLFDGIF
jgi:Protein of unknown function (DUF3035)